MQSFPRSVSEIDLVFRVDLGGRRQTIGAEVKFTPRPLGQHEVKKAAMARQGLFDRMLLLSRSGFSSSAQEEANRIGFGLLDLLTPADLRRWIEKNAYADADDRQTAELIIRHVCENAQS